MPMLRQAHGCARQDFMKDVLAVVMKDVWLEVTRNKLSGVITPSVVPNDVPLVVAKYLPLEVIKTVPSKVVNDLLSAVIVANDEKIPSQKYRPGHQSWSDGGHEG